MTEIEHFGAFGDSAIKAGALAHRATLPSKKLGTNALFSWSEIAKAKSEAKKFEKNIRVVASPVDGNAGHAEIRHFDDSDFELLEHFSTEVFVDYVVVSDLQLPEP